MNKRYTYKRYLTESSATLWNSIKWRVRQRCRVDSRLEKWRRKREERKNVCKVFVWNGRDAKVLKIPIHAKSTCFFVDWLVLCCIHISRIIILFQVPRAPSTSTWPGLKVHDENMRMKFYNLWLLLHMCTRKTPRFECLVCAEKRTQTILYDDDI